MKASFFIKKPSQRIRLEIERVLRQFQSGMHRSALCGTGAEFQRLRPYSPFDSAVSIDDMASSRLSEDPEFKPYSRVRYEHKKISVVMAVDVGESMHEPPAKETHTAALFWLFALSVFKSYDRLRVILFSGQPLYDSDWLEGEEGLEEFLARCAFSEKPRPGLSRFLSTFTYFAELELRDSLVVILSDFCWAWRDEPSLLRRLGLAERNVKMLFCALDEWAGFTPTGYGMAIHDPKTHAVRQLSATELLEVKEDSSRRLALIQESVRPLGIPLLTFPLLEPALEEARKKFLRLGFR